ncbi:MAG TPA: HlyD family secretion protein [Kofleriaceae bacterium]|jgi:membrane fusion protein (multidrug efflux system)
MEAAVEIPHKRRTPRLIAALAVIAATGWGGWHWLHRGQESTDDAFVEGRVATVSARVSGQVKRVLVADNQLVAAGDVLVEIDPDEFEARVAAAKADVGAAQASADNARAALALTERTAPAALAQAQGNLVAARSSEVSARASIEQARADLAAAEAKRGLADITLTRARKLFESGASPRAELDERQTELDAAVATVAEMKARVAVAQAAVPASAGGVAFATGRVDGARTTDQQIAAAKAAVALADAKVAQTQAAARLAELALSYTKVRAPHAGLVSRRVVEVGQTTSPERPLLALVQPDDLWIVANFKEDQLAEMRPGQRAELRFDMFGRRDFAGRVDSIAGATGSRFALIPPDNATGNFVKVVQRVPVLIRLDAVPADVELRPGMSADVTVHVAE